MDVGSPVGVSAVRLCRFEVKMPSVVVQGRNSAERPSFSQARNSQAEESPSFPPKSFAKPVTWTSIFQFRCASRIDEKVAPGCTVQKLGLQARQDVVARILDTQAPSPKGPIRVPSPFGVPPRRLGIWEFSRLGANSSDLFMGHKAAGFDPF